MVSLLILDCVKTGLFIKSTKTKESVMGTVPANKNEQNFQENANSNLGLLEEKVIRLVDMVKASKQEILTVKQLNQVLHEANQTLQEENQMLKHQLMRAESSLVTETKDLEDLSQEKMMTKMILDDLIKSIDSLVEQKE